MDEQTKIDDQLKDEEKKPDATEEQPQQAVPRAISVMDTEASSMLDPNMYAQMKAIASDFFKSGVTPPAYKNPLQVLMALQIGKEMGMQPAESLQSLTVVNGAFSVWGKAIPRRLREHGWKLKYEDGGDGLEQYCTATISRMVNDDTYGMKQHLEEYSETITYKDAELSGYTKTSTGSLKPGWLPGLNRKLKLRYDVLDVLVKTYVPEVLGPTAGTAEVLMDVQHIDGDSVKNDRKELMREAEAKRKQLDDKGFTPEAK